jgi:hypothetical protein
MAKMSALKIILVFSPLYSSKNKTAQREDGGPAKKAARFPKGGHFRAEVGPKWGRKIHLVGENAGICIDPAPAFR